MYVCMYAITSTRPLEDKPAKSLFFSILLLLLPLLAALIIRIGTILEMVRAIVIRLVEQNLRVRVCVQQSMGVGIFTGVPKQLSGVSRLVQMMDWQAEEGEENEGMIGDYLNFGSVGKEQVVNAHVNNQDGTKVEQDDVFIIIAPQSMVGIETSIYGPLSEMVQAAGDRPVILINPDLTDKVSSEGQQSVRGRQERIDFADSFKTIWHFQNIYISGTSYFPILGTMTKMSPLAAWVAHQRRDLANNGGELYIPVLAGEEMPKGDVVLENFER
jgi:adenylate kinase